MFTKFRNLVLYWASCIHSPSWDPQIILKLSSHPHLVSPVSVLFWGFRADILCAFRISPVCLTCPHLVVINAIAPFCSNNISWAVPHHVISQFDIVSPSLSPNLLNTSFPINIPLQWTGNFHTHNLKFVCEKFAVHEYCENSVRGLRA
jgi:hypothetical protein